MGGISYNWSSPGTFGGSVIVTPLVNTTYTVTVTDVNLCSATDNVTIFIKTITMSFATINVTCHGYNDGIATVTSTSGLAPYTYEWSDLLHQTTSAATNLYPGTYRVTITDADLCSGIDTVQIFEPALLIGFASSTNAYCYGDSNGTATLSAFGGTPPYFYSTTSDGVYFYLGSLIGSLPAGTYSTELTDANGCLALLDFGVNQPTPITMNYVTNEPRCYGYSDGIIFVYANGGNPPYDMLLDESQNTTGWFIDLAAGNHNLTITDTKGCSETYVIPLTQPNPIIVDINPDSLILELGETGQFFTTFSGAPADSVIFQWNTSNGLSCTDCPNPYVSPYTDQVYEVSVIDMSDISNPRPCFGTAIGYVFINEGKPIYIPNAFTPNADGTNDFFQVYGNGLKKVYMQIFDRYGELLFQSSQQDNGWNGTYQDKLVEPGVYVYKVVADYLNNIRIEKTGSVTLIR